LERKSHKNERNKKNGIKERKREGKQQHRKGCKDEKIAIRKLSVK